MPASEATHCGVTLSARLRLGGRGTQVALSPRGGQGGAVRCHGRCGLRRDRHSAATPRLASHARPPCGVLVSCLAAPPVGAEPDRLPHPSRSGDSDASGVGGGCLRRAGFDVATAAHAYARVDSFAYGFALQQINVERGMGGDLESPETITGPMASGGSPPMRRGTLGWCEMRDGGGCDRADRVPTLWAYAGRVSALRRGDASRGCARPPVTPPDG